MTARLSFTISPSVFDEVPENLRRVVLVLYGFVTPPFVAATYLLTPPGEWRGAPAAAVFVLCAIGFVAGLPKRRVDSFGWVLTGPVVPMLCCGIAANATQNDGLGFIIAIVAPLSWAAVLFGRTVVVAAYVTAVVTVFGVASTREPLWTAMFSTGLVAQIYGLVALVVYGKSKHHRELAEALRSSQQQFSTVFERTPDAVYITDRGSGTFLHINPGFERLTGYSREHTLGRTSKELELWVDYDDRGRFMAELAERRSVRNFVAEFRHSSGARFWGETSGDIVTIGDRACLMMITHDLTERRRAALEIREERDFSKLVMSTMTQGLTVVDQSLKFIYVNPAYARLLDRTAEELVGQSPLDFTAPEAIGALILAATSRKDGVTSEYESVLVRRDGTRVPVLISGAPRWSGGRVSGSIAVITDLTAQKEEAERRTNIERQMQEAQRRASLGTMAGGVAHHFNNLLTAINLGVELAMTSPGVPPWAANELRHARAAGNRAASISGMMLDYLGTRRQRARRMRLTDVAEHSVPFLRTAMPENVQFELDLPPSTLEVHVDQVGFNQVINNIVTNAWESMDGQPGLISMSVRRVYRDTMTEDAIATLPADVNEFVGIEIRDTGRGMTSEELRRAFEPFFSSKAVGRGLGLSVSQGIVQSYHGTIILRSGGNSGTQVMIVLPVAPPSPAESASAPLVH